MLIIEECEYGHSFDVMDAGGGLKLAYFFESVELSRPEIRLNRDAGACVWGALNSHRSNRETRLDTFHMCCQPSFTYKEESWQINMEKRKKKRLYHNGQKKDEICIISFFLSYFYDDDDEISRFYSYLLSPKEIFFKNVNFFYISKYTLKVLRGKKKEEKKKSKQTGGSTFSKLVSLS